ncbi:MAG TPA: sigma-70 family RNA polymerase sigma factor [Parafilimonas sp.]|nr:sigma-70 family RNA polymerase sigma factor [Parafilimonas sp.]
MKNFEHYPDLEIIQRILNGDMALYEILIRRNDAALYKIGRSYNYNHEDTQDLMQDSFIDAYCHLKSFDNRSSFKTWLIKIMLNNCYRKQRKFSYKKEVLAEINENARPAFSNQRYTDTNKTIVNKELNSVIENALEGLPLDHRLVFSLREINGLSVAETADILSISYSNVKVRLNRAKAILRKEIERSYSPQDIFEFNLVYCDTIVNAVMSKLESMREQQ